MLLVTLLAELLFNFQHGFNVFFTHGYYFRRTASTTFGFVYAFEFEYDSSAKHTHAHIRTCHLPSVIFAIGVASNTAVQPCKTANKHQSLIEFRESRAQFKKKVMIPKILFHRLDSRHIVSFCPRDFQNRSNIYMYK